MNVLILIALACILMALAAAGYFMLRSSDADDMTDDEAVRRKKRMARALTLRIAISVLLFTCVLAAWYMGWISPTGIAAGR